MIVDTTGSRLGWRPRGMDARLAVAIVVTFGSLLLLVSVTWLNTTRLIREARWVDHSKDVIAELEGFQYAITEGETGQRGFLITGDDVYLEPYRRAAAELPERLLRIGALTADNPAQHERSLKLHQLAVERLGQLDLAVRLVKAGREPEARAYIRTGEGRETMEKLLRVIAGMKAEERALLAARDERSGATARNLLTTLGIGCVLLFAFLVLIWWLIRSDLARRNRAEAAIRERETRIRRLVDANLVGVLFSDDGGVTDANDTFLSIVGLTKEGLRSGNHELYGFTAPEYRHLDEICEKEIRETGTCRPFQKELVRADGTRVPVLFGQTSVDMGGASPVRASFVVDLSELKRVEAERNRLYEEARDAVKARDAFLSVAGHEIRTPLSALNLLVYQLSRHARALGNEKAIDLADRCEKQLARLIGLADELLDVSRISAGTLHLNPEETDLAQIAADTAERFEESARRAGCALEVRAPETLTGYWDRLRLEQVLSNLLTNAMKFGAGEPVLVEVSSRGPDACVSVADRGIGIHDEDQRRIFERFQRGAAAGAYPGMGLGLWITREIVEAHGGRISVESRPGAGATFRVTLPRRTVGDLDGSGR
ncbi:MAG TPA: CHASE3 domain-containing protein [Thermoanaerobaculia bacterium]|nr:CHASE3 domain-containing protein [Thermoanaerobaculia bacterium]